MLPRLFIMDYDYLPSSVPQLPCSFVASNIKKSIVLVICQNYKSVDVLERFTTVRLARPRSSDKCVVWLPKGFAFNELAFPNTVLFIRFVSSHLFGEPF